MDSRTWRVIQQDIVLNFKRKGYLVMTFLVPLLIVGIAFGVTFYLDRQQNDPEEDAALELPDAPVGYVDDSGLFPNAGEFAGFLIPYYSETAARAAVEAGDLSAYYYVPADYMETGEVFRYSVGLNIIDSADQNVFNHFLLITLLGNEDPTMLARLQSRPTFTQHQLDTNGEEILEVEGDAFDSYFWLVYAFAMVMMFSTFFSSGQLMASVIKEKENRMIEVVLSSIRPFQIMGGKIVGQGVAGLVQIVCWVGAGALVLRIAEISLPGVELSGLPPSLIVIVLLYYFGGYALFAAFAAGIGAVSASMREGPQLAMIYTMPAMLPMLFLSQIVVEPNGTMATFFSFFPLTAPIGMVARVVLTAVPPWQIGVSLLILYVSVLGGLWVGTRLFRVNTLLSGQAPSRKQLIQLIRG